MTNDSSLLKSLRNTSTMQILHLSFFFLLLFLESEKVDVQNHLPRDRNVLDHFRPFLYLQTEVSVTSHIENNKKEIEDRLRRLRLGLKHF